MTLYDNNDSEGSLPKKTVLFGSIDPNVGGWGQVDPNFYKSLFFMAHLTIFLSKISGKFMVNDPNLEIWVKGPEVGSQVWVN